MYQEIGAGEGVPRPTFKEIGEFYLMRAEESRQLAERAEPDSDRQRLLLESMRSQIIRGAVCIDRHFEGEAPNPHAIGPDFARLVLNSQ